MRAPWSLRAVLSLLAVLGSLTLGASEADAAALPAASAAPHWSITSFAAPRYFKPSDSADFYTLIVRNDGAAPSDGSVVTVADSLPPGVTATHIEGVETSEESRTFVELECELGALTCKYEHPQLGGPPVAVAGATLWVKIKVSVAPGAQSCPTCVATVSGGGAPPASVGDPTVISPEAVPFGFSRFGADIVNPSGEPDRQAGSHPFEMTTSFALNVAALDTEEGLDHNSLVLAGAAKDLNVALPPGLIGNPNAVPRCSQVIFQSSSGAECPADTQVGTILFTIAGQSGEGHADEDEAESAVYDVAPPSGQPAELGFNFSSVKIRILFHVRSDGTGDYGLTALTPEITQLKPLLLGMLTIWGTPADPSHDNERVGALRPGGKAECKHPVEQEKFKEEVRALEEREESKQAEIEVKQNQRSEAEEKGETERAEKLEKEATVLEAEKQTIEFHRHELEATGAPTAFGCPSDVPAKPFLRMPTSCQDMLALGAQSDSWGEPGRFVEPLALATVPGPTGCEGLSFDPSLAVEPETRQSTSPSGYTVELRVPQNEEPNALATSDLQNASVALPAGTVASPSAANGLQACSDEQFARLSTAPASCPAPSRIGTVKIHSPLLPSPGFLEGQLYLGQPECAPCAPADAESGRMIRLFLQAQGFGVTVKLVGRTSLNQSTGQLTTTFERNPQLPFEELTLKLNGGPRAPLANPATCGVFTATSSLEPWSGPPAATPSGPFAIEGCTAARFSPSFTAGTINNQAAASSAFTLTFSRADQDQDFQALAVHMPPGLLGMLSKVQLCPEPQASIGACGPQSQIGTTTVASGPGTSPFYLGGSVFLTGPYKGAPFGLSILVHAQAGPFDLGTVVVRSAITVDPRTSAITVASDPLPSIVDGVPTQIRTVNVNINREGFMFNATNCNPLAIEGTLSSTQGATFPVSSSYEVANCANLPFKPAFTVSTQGKTNKANGASLDVKIAQKPGEANIRKVDVTLPLALPSRLTTLQKACSETQFASNPAGCPAGSNVGIATAHTPVLNAPLMGPAYLVSHGGAAFPDLDVVLQGEGIKIELVGNTDIKKGTTFSRFETVPDAPISSFELDLPQGPHSALAANGNLCEKSLVMPTTIVGQNGAQVTPSTTVSVTGCPPTIKVKKARVKGNAVLLTFTTTQRGTVTVTARGLKTTRKTLGAGTHLIKVPLTRVGRAARKAHKRTRIKVSVKNLQGSTSKTTSIKL